MNETMTPKILVADDDLTFLEIAGEKLSQRGFQVLVSTLSEAVSILKKEVISTVFVDYNKVKSDAAKVISTVESLEDKPLIQYFGKLAEMDGSQQLHF